MLARYEKRIFKNELRVWCGKYLNLKNISHYHDEIEIIYVNYGRATVFLNDTFFSLESNQSFYVPQGTIHKIIADNSALLTTFIISPELNPNLLKYQPNNFLLSKNYSLNSLYELYINELRKQKPFFKTRIENEFMAKIIDIFRQEGYQKCQIKYNNDYLLLKNILKEIEDNYQKITFSAICEKFSYSPSHFSRLFEKINGLTFTTYLSYIRIEKAIELIKENKYSFTDIASLSGFSSIRNFNRVFKKLTSYSPKSLPQDYELNNIKIKLFPEAFDPTEKSSVLIDDY